MFNSAAARTSNPRGRLAAIARHLVLRPLAGESLIGMVRAVVDPVQVGAFFAQQGFQFGVDPIQFELGYEPLGDRRLVGRDHQPDTPRR